MRIDLRTWLRLPVPTLLLGTCVIAMGLGLVIVLAGGTRAQALLATPARKLPPMSFDATPIASTSDLAAIQSQPLLHASRAFHRKPVDAAPSAPPRPDYRLAGTVIQLGKSPVAVIIDRQNNLSRRVKAGDDVDGWRVLSVDRKQVVLGWNTERTEITSGRSLVAGTSAATSTGDGFKRMPIHRQQATAATGVQALRASGSSILRGTRGVDETPRIYRPPPQ